MGNLCFSFLLPHDSSVDFKKINTQIIINSFANLGVNVEAAGRNDMLVEGRKISGSAFKINLGNKKFGPKSLHHGTILLNVDLNNMQRYLNPNKLKLISKGVDSVKSRVLNLNEKFPHLDKEIVFNQIQKDFLAYHKADLNFEKIELEDENYCKVDKIKDLFKYYNSWQWKYGECPEFTNSLTHKFDWGLVDLCLRVEKGNIYEAVIFSDCLVTEFIDLLNSVLIELKDKFTYDFKGLNSLFDHILLNYSEFTINKDYQRFLIDIKRELINYI